LQKFDARREAPGVFLSWAGAVESIITPMDNLTPLDGSISSFRAFSKRTEVSRRGDRRPGHLLDVPGTVLPAAPRDAVELWKSRALALARTTRTNV